MSLETMMNFECGNTVPNQVRRNIDTGTILILFVVNDCSKLLFFYYLLISVKYICCMVCTTNEYLKNHL